MTKRVLVVALVGVMIGTSTVFMMPQTSHAQVTDAQVQAQGVQTEQSIVTTLTDYFHFLQLRYIQQLEAKVLELKQELHERQSLHVS